MRIVTVVWSMDGDAERFDRGVPLKFIAHRNRVLGFSTNIDLVFLGGMKRLAAEYLGELREVGFSLHDAEDLYKRHQERTPGLRRLGSFNHRSFLRWPVLGELFPGEPILHIDGDVIYNEDPVVLAGHFSGRTLVLQGCSGIVAIADRAWYQQYARALDDYLRDIDAYTAMAVSEWKRCAHEAGEKWAGSLSDRFIAHEQDFLSHLICTGRIVQDSPAEFLRNCPEHLYFENPLLIGSLVPGRPVRYFRRGGTDFFGDRQVAFWHMQTDWCRYLTKYLVRERLGPLAQRGRVSFGRRDVESVMVTLLRKLGGDQLFSRRSICERLFERGDFSAIFTEDRWWQPGVFSAENDAGNGNETGSALRG